MYHSRIRNEVQVTRETLSAMKERLEDAVSKILPGMPLDVVAFACTSASMVIGCVIQKRHLETLETLGFEGL